MSATENDMDVDVRGLGAVAVLVPRITYLNYVSSDDVKNHMKHLCATNAASGAKTIVLDLTNVTVVDSCGLSLLISVKKTADGHGVRFALCGLSPVILRLFEITKLDRAFAIYPDAETAARDAR